MNFNNLFVTVGTTKFKKLIDKFQDKDTIDILKQLKCKQLIIQAGEYDLDSFDLASFQSAGIDVNIFNYANTLHEHMNKTDLIIGHAGAGTCLEGLRLAKRMLIVINEDLMDNHQTELAIKLTEKNYALHCTIDNLNESLINMQDKQFKQFPQQDTTILASYIDNLFKDF